MNTANRKLVRKLADEFVRQLRDNLDAGEFEQVRKRNSRPEYSGGVCASHDFIDANEVMASAFVAVTGREVDCDSGSDCVLWSNAWDIAKRESLTAHKPQIGEPIVDKNGKINDLFERK